MTFYDCNFTFISIVSKARLLIKIHLFRGNCLTLIIFIRKNLISFQKNCIIYFVLMVTGLYYGTSICLVTFASGLSVLTLNIYHRGVRGASVPNIVRTLVLERMARLVFMRFEMKSTTHRSSKIQVIFL